MGSTILKSDIFFVVTTTSVVLVSVGIIIVFFYLISILKDLKILSRKTKVEVERILDDIRILREGAHKRGAEVSQFFSFITSRFGILGKPIRKKSTNNKTEIH